MERERALQATAGRRHGVLNVERLRQIGFGRRRIEHRVRFTYRHLTRKPGWVASNLRQALGVQSTPRAARA